MSPALTIRSDTQTIESPHLAAMQTVTGIPLCSGRLVGRNMGSRRAATLRVCSASLYGFVKYIIPPARGRVTLNAGRSVRGDDSAVIVTLPLAGRGQGWGQPQAQPSGPPPYPITTKYTAAAPYSRRSSTTNPSGSANSTSAPSSRTIVAPGASHFPARSDISACSARPLP